MWKFTKLLRVLGFLAEIQKKFWRILRFYSVVRRSSCQHFHWMQRPRGYLKRVWHDKDGIRRDIEILGFSPGFQSTLEILWRSRVPRFFDMILRFFYLWQKYRWISSLFLILVGLFSCENTHANFDTKFWWKMVFDTNALEKRSTTKTTRKLSFHEKISSFEFIWTYYRSFCLHN